MRKCLRVANILRPSIGLQWKMNFVCFFSDVVEMYVASRLSIDSFNQRPTESSIQRRCQWNGRRPRKKFINLNDGIEMHKLVDFYTDTW